MSKEAIKGLKPEGLWQRFYEISQVPRPSKKEGKILEHLRNLFKDLKLSYKEDKTGNILVSVPASKGYENAPTVVLQGHVDMVCEKNRGTEHDFDNDPIKLKRVDGWIAAEGTTLGSDNGIGVAAAIAVATDPNAKHGPLEILLTVDEETGLTGANNLEPGFVKGKILLNLDSEEDGAFYVGCSGGIDTMGTFKSETESAANDFVPHEIMVTGLKGGHSGLDITTGRGNGIKILARALKSLEKLNYFLTKIDGGSKRNAIPREAEAIVLIKSSDWKQALDVLNEFQEKVQNEFKTSDSGLKIEFKKADKTPSKVFTKSFTTRIINTLLALPHGVISMSQDIPGLVETSTNVATINTGDDAVIIGTSQRSSIDSAKRYIAQSVEATFKLADAEVKTGDGYPGWKPDMDSNILKTSKKAFKNLFNKEPEIKAIHAGLECGILGDKNPGIDMISFGPTITGAHSPDERVNIETVEKFYNLLKA
ncbi:MAG: aminoacyl-histidine dipeptidase, partial [Ignavibacteriaceae bacterium]